METRNEKLQDILSTVERHSAITGLPIETHIESLKIFLKEHRKGKSFEESVRIAAAFLDEKEAIATTNSNRHAKKELPAKEV